MSNSIDNLAGAIQTCMTAARMALSLGNGDAVRFWVRQANIYECELGGAIIALGLQLDALP